MDTAYLKTEVEPACHFNRKLLWRILHQARPCLARLVVLAFVLVCDALVTTTTPLVYRDLINNGITRADFEHVVSASLVAAILSLVGAGLSVCTTYLSASIGAKIVFDLRARLFAHIQTMPLSFFSHVHAGRLASRLGSDVAGVSNSFTDILLNVIGSGFSGAMILVAMVAISWRITLVSLLPVPVLFVLLRHLAGQQRRLVRDNMDLFGSMNAMLVECFTAGSACLSRLLGNCASNVRAFEVQAMKIAVVSVRGPITVRLSLIALVLLASLTTALAYGWGGMLVLRHVMDIGTLVAFATYLARLYLSFAGLSNIQTSVMSATVAFERVFQILDLPTSVTEDPEAIPIPPGTPRICLSNVSFRYPHASTLVPDSLAAKNNNQARECATLNKVTFSVEPGEVVALRGPSGAGKTTICRLVARLYDVDSGTITINGLDLRKATFASLQKRIGFVTQDTYILHGTIRTNLLCANPEATDEEIRSALQSSGLSGLISSLPLGLDTLVGDCGCHLSGGERQKVSIARILLRNPDVILLDEATANLDTDSELTIREALRSALIGRTVIVISHSESPLLVPDRIFVVKDGVAAEQKIDSRCTKRGKCCVHHEDLVS